MKTSPRNNIVTTASYLEINDHSSCHGQCRKLADDTNHVDRGVVWSTTTARFCWSRCMFMYSNFLFCLFPFLPFDNAEKLPVGKVGTFSKHSISPDQPDEIDALRAKNKVLTDALAAIHQKAKKETEQKYDLVWYAKYRCKCWFCSIHDGLFDHI
jgi:hypothetical protein